MREESNRVLHETGKRMRNLLNRIDRYLVEHESSSVFMQGNIAHSKQRISRVQYDSINIQKEISECIAVQSRMNGDSEREAAQECPMEADRQ